MATAMAHSKEEQHWQIDKSLPQCLAHMLHNDFELNDVTFRVNFTHGENSEKPESIRALQLLLLARSPVFYSMFTGDLATGEKPEIDIPDIEPQAFKELLRFIYTDEVELTAENVTGVLYASKKYMVTNLTKRCVKFLEDLLSADTAPQLLDQSMLFEEKDLKEKVLETIVTEASAVLSSNDFCKISQQALHEVLQLNLKITKELVVFKAAMKWAEKKCEELKLPKDGANLREALGDCVNSIRFPTMDLDEFNEVVAPTEVLTESEGYQMMRYLAAKTRKPVLKLSFSTEPRNVQTQAASPSIPISDTTTRQLVIPGPYASRQVCPSDLFNQYSTTTLTCQLSKPIQLKKILIHSPNVLSPRLIVTLKQHGITIHSFSGNYHPVNEGNQGLPVHFDVAVNDISVAAGAFELDINIWNNNMIRVSCSPSSVSKLANEHLTITFPPTEFNFLLGIEYSLAV